MDGSDFQKNKPQRCEIRIKNEVKTFYFGDHIRTRTVISKKKRFTSGVATGGGGYNPPQFPSNDVIHTSFSDTYFEVLDTLLLIIWFCNCHNNKNYVALFLESCSLP